MRKITALIVDDMDSVRQVLRRFLQSIGCDPAQIVDTPSAELAIDFLRSRPVDLIFLDVHMPGMTGIEFLRNCASEDLLRGAKIVMLSGKPTASMVQEALVYGACRFVAKPFDLADFKLQITELFASETIVS